MSSNGVMLQDYVPNAINNLTEEIWCAGAVIPAGKRVVIGHMRDGGVEITFTMGLMEDFIGMAIVPPSVVGIEEPKRIPGVGFMPQGVAAMAVRRQRDFKRPTIDQSAPLPPSSPNAAYPGAQSASQAYTSALRQQALPANQSRAPRAPSRPYQWGGLHGHGVGDVPEELPEGWPESASPGTGIAIPSYVPGQAQSPEQVRSAGILKFQQVAPNPPSTQPPTSPPKVLVATMTTMMPGSVRGWNSTTSRKGSRGFGAGGASPFTMTAANALNQELITNNCAGCADMTSRLRQLTFAFKAAVATDTGMPVQNLNMSNMLAMTAYGPATDAALKLVLGAGSAYANGPCTDDAGNCLGNIPTPITPQSIQAIEQQLAQQIQAAIPQTAYLPQADIVHTLVQAFSSLVTQFTTELAKVKYNLPNPLDQNKPATPPATTPATGIPWSSILIGGLIGTTILATGAFVYTHARHA